MSGYIFLRSDKSLIRFTEQPYETETLLQTLLADYPDLLAGDQINLQNPRRWIFVQREMGVSDGVSRCSLDHLFIDQEGIPTLVEVKRSSDTRIRREVVGQMLDYAANGAMYWKTGDVRVAFERQCAQNARQPDQVIKGLNEDIDIENYWQTVEENLRSGRLRLLFVADVIPPELQRVIEFLNEQMKHTEVLGIEVKQYAYEGQQMLVPRVIGQTSEAQQTKGQGRRAAGQWNEESFLSTLIQKTNQDTADIAQKFIRWLDENGIDYDWGQGTANGSIKWSYTKGKIRYPIIYIYSEGTVELPFEHLRTRPPFNDVVKRQAWLHKIQAIPRLQTKHSDIDKRPSFPLAALKTDEQQILFLETIRWVIAQIEEYYAHNS